MASENKAKTILITGANRGLGSAMAHKFIQRGHKVIATSRNYEFINHVTIAGGKVIKQHLDVTNENSVQQFFTWLNLLNIHLDALINNAGVGIFKPLAEITLDEWNRMIQTNLTGAFLCSKEAYKNMQSGNGGRIINIGSIAEKIPLQLNSAYGSSKAGLKALSAITNEEGKLEKIRVTHITLGATYTDIWKTRTDFKKEDMLNPELVADCISYIALLPLEIRIDKLEILPEKGIL